METTISKVKIYDGLCGQYGSCVPVCSSKATIKKPELARISALYGCRKMCSGTYFFCEFRFDPGGFICMDNPFSSGPVERADGRLETGRLLLGIFLGLHSFNSAAKGGFHRSIPLAGLFCSFHPFRSRFVFGQSGLLSHKFRRNPYISS